MAAVGAAAMLFLGGTVCADDEATLAKGEYLLHAGGCISCHTGDEEGAHPLAGGHALESPFGVFYSPNITPDQETGIGAWTDEDFLTAFWEGKNPDGDHYFPAFPYPAYTGMSRADVLALKAYLFSVEPVRKENKEHDLWAIMSSRFSAGVWKTRYFDAERFAPDPQQNDEWNRGAYLVRHLGHCGECHTPRSTLGALEKDKELAGNPELTEDESAPNITPHKTNGIGRWSVSDIDYFLEIGMLPDGDFTGSSMGPVIEDNTSHLTREDRRAIAVYLKSVSPL
jgi:mono/diheme cytochrome c family protein